MIRAHLLAEIKPRSVGPACVPLQPHHLVHYNAVCVILRKRLNDQKRKEESNIKAAKNTDISSVYSMKPTVEQVTEQWMRAIVKRVCHLTWEMTLSSEQLYS